jgi:hypothetical protein
MPSLLQSAALASLANYAPASNEGAVTVRLASELAATANQKTLWIAGRHHASLPATLTKKTSYPAKMKSYDLATSSVSAATIPEMLVQVKWRHTGSEVQGLHLFLGDLALAAVDAHLMGLTNTRPKVFGVSVMPKTDYDSSTYWKPLIAQLVGSAVLVLEPILARNSNLHHAAPAAQWIDVAAKEVKPVTRPQFNRILSAGTSGKYLGVFHRPGRLRLSLNVESFTGGNKCGFVVEVVSSRLEAVAAGITLEQWWP